MNFGQKLKDIRKAQGLSQEQLAEKIGVSRQAITKWETGRGLPDMENMMILAEIFKTTLDELVSEAMPEHQTVTAPVWHSETVYDVDMRMHFDIHIGAANRLTVCSGDDEKLRVDFASETMENIGSLFKVKLDEKHQKLDVDCIKKDGVSRYEAADALWVTITLPKGFTAHCEVAASVHELRLTDLTLDRLEYDGDAQRILVRNCCGGIDLTSRTDYDITVDGLRGCLDINQWKSTAILHISETADFRVQNRGRGCQVFVQKDGDPAEVCGSENSENILSVSGMKSELIVDLV